jgi:pimeloyl-ACP methyl ester carboxylesterase
MPQMLTRDGCCLHYSLRGEGPLIALTPGGREAGEAVAALAGVLAARATVLTWDRRNTGASDVFFGGTSEQDVWADDLAALIAGLGLGPAWLAGGSAGCRVSLLTAVRHPQVARGLVLWSASGGPYGCQFLGFQYHVPYIMAAELGGMDAVARSPFFAARIAARPANRERLLALAPADFIAVLKRWNSAFYFREDSTVAGVTDDELRSIRCPALIFEGGDDIHPAAVAQNAIGLLPCATLLPSPWSAKDWMDRFTGRIAGSVFELYPLMAPAILDFVEAQHGRLA